MPTLRVANLHARSVSAALADSATRLDACRDGVARLTITTLVGPAVVLGARQRAGRVVSLDACADANTPVYRRATTGTAAYVGHRALLWSLALPDVAAIFHDATRATVINRNVRLLLRGLTAAGALAQYFGREWVAVRHRAAAVLGYDITRDGRTLVEAIIGWDVPIALPWELCTDAERRIERWRGRAPIALTEVLDADAIDGVTRRLLDAVASRAEAVPAHDEAVNAAPAGRVTEADDPAAPMTRRCEVEVPVGYVEAARVGEGLWLGGDALCAGHALDDAAEALCSGRAPPGDDALLGATWADFECASSALGA